MARGVSNSAFDSSSQPLKVSGRHCSIVASVQGNQGNAAPGGTWAAAPHCSSSWLK